MKGLKNMNKKIGKYVFLTILYSAIVYGVFFPASEALSADYAVINGITSAALVPYTGYSGNDVVFRFPMPPDGVVSPPRWRNAGKLNDAEYFNPLYRLQSKVY